MFLDVFGTVSLKTEETQKSYPQHPVQ